MAIPGISRMRSRTAGRGADLMVNRGTPQNKSGRVGTLDRTIGADLLESDESKQNIIRKAAMSVVGRRSSPSNEGGSGGSGGSGSGLEERMNAIEETQGEILSTLRSMAGGDDEAENAEDEEETAENADDSEDAENMDDEEKPSSKAGNSSGGNAGKPASVAQIRAACDGASDAFVLNCVEAGLTLNQAKTLFKKQKPAVNLRGGRSMVRRGSGRSSNSVGDQIRSAAENFLSKNPEMSRQDALGHAINTVAKHDPEGVMAWREAETAKRRRQDLGLEDA